MPQNSKLLIIGMTSKEWEVIEEWYGALVNEGIETPEDYEVSSKLYKILSEQRKG